MKFWLLYIIICALLLSANPVFALNYQEPFINASESWVISSSQLSAARLLQNYVESYQNRINELYRSYEWWESPIISNFNIQMSNMDKSLGDIRNNKYNSRVSSNIMSKTVSDLKSINTRMKVFLEQKKSIYLDSIKQKQLVLWQIWQQISDTLDTLLLSVSNQLVTKKSLTKKEKELVEILITLREENIKMKNFMNITFLSSSEMNQYLRDVIWSIRIEFKKIRSL